MLQDKDLLSIQEVRTKVDKAYAAWQKYRNYSQEQVDAIVERMAAAARANAKRLADLAVEETGYGNAKDKYVKNLLCSRLASPPHARHEDRRHSARDSRTSGSSKSAFRWAWLRRFCRPPIPPPPRSTRR